MKLTLTSASFSIFQELLTIKKVYHKNQILKKFDNVRIDYQEKVFMTGITTCRYRSI